MTSRRWRCFLAGAAVLFLLAPRVPGARAQSRSNPIVTTLILFAGTPAGLHRSRDWGSSWQRVERHSLAGDDPQALGAVHAILPLGPLVYAGGDHGLLVSEDFGENWRRRELAGPVLSIMASRYAAADPTVFVGTPRGLLRSRDAGVRFEPVGLEGVPVTRIEWPGPALLFATGRGVIRSDDGGLTFEGPGAGLPASAAIAIAASSFFAIDPTLFASVASGGVFYSADGSRAWRPSGLEGRTVSDLVWFGPYLYAVTDVGLLRSEDSGRTWAPLGQGLQGQRLRRLVFPTAPQSGAEALVTAEQGLFRSFDGGHQWQRMGLEGPVNCVATFPPPDPPRKNR